MGSHPYFYFIEYQPDINAALQTLRKKEFEAGRYDPAMNMYDSDMWMFRFVFPPNAQSISPGARHDSIEAAIEETEACGTGSILDIEKISETPEFLACCPLSKDEILALFGTNQPTRQMVEDFIISEVEQPLHWEEISFDIDDFFGSIGRGESLYIILYENNQPSEIFFIGYSVD